MGLPSFNPNRKTESARRSFQLGGVLALALVWACQDPTVRFGPPNNLRQRDSKSVEVCEPPPGATGATCPEWETEVFPLLDNETNRCTNEACHSEQSPSKGLALYKGDAAKTYAALAKYKNAAGRPYVADADMADPELPPYMLCNLSANPLVGSRMPLGEPMGADDLTMFGNWALCGMKEMGGTPVPSGAGGAGGS
jgi:hypothetical protein